MNSKYKVCGLNHRDFVLFYKVCSGVKPLSCILVRKNINAFLLNFSNNETTAVRLEDGRRGQIVISAYFIRELPSPPESFRDVYRNIRTRYKNETAVVGCDANSRHSTW